MSKLSVFVAEHEGQSIRMTPDGRFSVHDVLVAFIKPTVRKGIKGKAINPTQLLKTIAGKYPEVIQKMENFKFPGRGQRETPVTNEEGMYQILMLCPGQRGAEFRQLAAKVLRERREEEANPELGYSRARTRLTDRMRRDGRSEKEIAQRLKAIDTRNYFTDTLKAHGVVKGYQYAQITNAIYEELLGGNADDIRRDRNLPARSNVRNSLNLVELAAVDLIEALSTRDIEDGNLQGFDPCHDTSRNIARKVRKVIE